MYTIILILHIIIVVGLLGVILVQRGRSGGLVEALGGVESIFGTKTNAFFVKMTVILAILFFCTSISLVYLSRERGKSLMEKYKDIAQQEEPAAAKEASRETVPTPKLETEAAQPAQTPSTPATETPSAAAQTPSTPQTQTQP
ncbi:MAG: preprotein translocase subunit SecG [Candidatus Omnitrophica bacterium]|nr:preprotein translocase subunit SecG [Candidatus Omnitrophota bacterium]